MAYGEQHASQLGEGAGHPSQVFEERLGGRSKAPVQQGSPRGSDQEGQVARQVMLHPKIDSDLDRLPAKVADTFHQRVDSLARGERHSSTHPLNGPLRGWQGTSIGGNQHRMIHRHEDGNLMVLSAGNHDQAYDAAIRRGAMGQAGPDYDNLSFHQVSASSSTKSFDELAPHEQAAAETYHGQMQHEQMAGEDETPRDYRYETRQEPVEQFKAKYMQGTFAEGYEPHEFNQHHRDVLAMDDIPHHSGGSRWPVIVNDENHNYIDDGFHRFHSYVRDGATHIPTMRMHWNEPQSKEASSMYTKKPYRMPKRSKLNEHGEPLCESSDCGGLATGVTDHKDVHGYAGESVPTCSACHKFYTRKDRVIEQKAQPDLSVCKNCGEKINPDPNAFDTYLDSRGEESGHDGHWHEPSVNYHTQHQTSALMKSSVQAPPADLHFTHDEFETGGSKYPTRVHLRAHTSEGQVGAVIYHPPKRSNGIVGIHNEFGYHGPPVKGEIHHPGGSESAKILTQHKVSSFTPHLRVFAPTCGMDHRLWEENGQLKPEVRSYVLRSMAVMWSANFPGWGNWAKVYFAGSEASEWTSATLEGNNDFDVLVGVDYSHLRDSLPAYRQMTNGEITDLMNEGFRAFNSDHVWIPIAPSTTGQSGLSAKNSSIPSSVISVTGADLPALPEGWYWTGPWSRTSFCNPDSYDIRKIKPYAAYDVGAERWIVPPPHLPHWDFKQLSEPVRKVLRATDTLARDVLKLPEPERTQQGAMLFDAWHTDRSRAFGPNGEGWWDIANLREKWLDQAGLWAEITNCKHRSGEGLGAALPGWSNTPRVASMPASGLTIGDPTKPLYRSNIDSIRAISVKIEEYEHDPERTWFHGSPKKFTEFKKVPSTSADWNTQLGTHFSSEHPIARSFGRHVYQVKLNMHSPKVYDSEESMDHDAMHREWRLGHTYANHPQREEIHGAGPRERNAWTAERHLQSGDFESAQKHAHDWLSAHPDRKGIADRFGAQLRSEGHDGIVYGNSFEGPGHASAIAFHPDQIERRETD